MRIGVLVNVTVVIIYGRGYLPELFRQTTPICRNTSWQNLSINEWYKLLLSCRRVDMSIDQSYIQYFFIYSDFCETKLISSIKVSTICVLSYGLFPPATAQILKTEGKYGPDMGWWVLMSPCLADPGPMKIKYFYLEPTKLASWSSGFCN